MQLTLLTELYKSETVEKNLIKNLIRLRSNIKYLRAEINSSLGSMYDSDPKFRRLSYMTNKIGYVLYWLALLGWLHSKDLSKWGKTTKEDWHAENLDRVYLSSTTARSPSDLYSISKTVESFSTGFKMAYSKNLNSTPLSRRLMKYYEESLRDLVKDLKDYKNAS